MARNHSPYIRLYIVFLSLIFSIVLAEITVRIISIFNIKVRYLAIAGAGKSPPTVNSLEDFAKAYPLEFIPHRNWLGFWTNRFGLYDKEFEIPKPPSRKRIIALGDSFNYGMVSLPDNVMTVAEEKIHTFCPNLDFDLLNMGAPSLGLLDYDKLLHSTAERFQADIVTVSIYMGNDLPDTYHGRESVFANEEKYHSYFFSLIKNYLRLRINFPDPLQNSKITKEKAQGGERSDVSALVTDDEIRRHGPTFKDDGWRFIAKNELSSLYENKNNTDKIEKSWATTYALLDSMVEEITKDKRRPVFLLFPSEFQIRPELIAKTLPLLQQDGKFTEASIADFNPDLPNQLVHP